MSRRVCFVALHTAWLITAGLVVWGLFDGWFQNFWEQTRMFFIWAAPFAPFSAAFVAFVAGLIAWLTYRHRRKADDRDYEHRRRADNRAEWWRRVQSAIDLATADADQIGRKTGLTLLDHLSQDQDVTRQDIQLIIEVTNGIIDEGVTQEEVLSTHEVERGRTFHPRLRTWLTSRLRFKKEDRRKSNAI